MGRISLKAGTILSPLPPVLVGCGDMEKSNILTVAWTGILSTSPTKTYISVRPSRYSYEILKEKKEFTMNLCPADYAREIDYCGTYTGRKVDKFQKCHFHKVASETIEAPGIMECPIILECKVLEIIPSGTHDIFISEITKMSIDESIMDKSGKICLEKANLCAYAHGDYYALGKKIGRFGFSTDKKKKTNTKKKPQDKKGIK